MKKHYYIEIEIDEDQKDKSLSKIYEFLKAAGIEYFGVKLVKKIREDHRVETMKKFNSFIKGCKREEF